MIEITRAQCKAAGIADDVFNKTKLTADADYSSHDSVTYTQAHHIDAYIADRNHRQRDPAFADADRYKDRPKGYSCLGTVRAALSRAGEHSAPICRWIDSALSVCR